MSGVDEHGFKAGDLVMVGTGKKVWVVDYLWTAHDGVQLASLTPVEGYAGYTVNVERLRRAASIT